ncbi:MAG: hypothetical protein LBS76_02670 [Mycoplasmataceae bacterium]|jgi:hypothetical protein|nr:hypothetical protein [Mycoplasmataceae bacterium]
MELPTREEIRKWNDEQLHESLHLNEKGYAGSGNAIKLVSMIKSELARRDRFYKSRWNIVSVVLSIIAIACSIVIPILVVYLGK